MDFFTLSLRTQNQGFLSGLINFSEDALCYSGHPYTIVNEGPHTLDVRLENPYFSTLEKIVQWALPTLAALGIALAIFADLPFAAALAVPLVACLVIKYLHRTCCLNMNCLHVLSRRGGSGGPPPPAPTPSSSSSYTPSASAAASSAWTPAPSKKKEDSLTFPPMQLGPQALVRFQAKGELTYYQFSDAEVKRILAQYPEANFRQAHPRYGTALEDLILATYKDGLPNYPFLKGQIKGMAALILQTLRADSPCPANTKKAIAGRLATAFLGCQKVQYDGLESITQDLLCRGNLDEAIRVWWQKYKTEVLEGFVGERHPGSDTVPDARPTEQFVHIFSAYVVLLGAEFGLDGVEAATADKVKPASVSKLLETNASVIAGYRQRLVVGLGDFAKAVILDINNDNPETSTIRKDLILNWAMQHGTKKSRDPTFGFYSPDHKNYKGLDKKPTEEQETSQAVYFCPEEVMFFLQEMGIITR